MTVTTTGNLSAGRPAFAALNAAANRVSTSLAAYRQRRAVYAQTRNELIKLSDRELADIGIPRSNIRRVALEAARMVNIDA